MSLTEDQREEILEKVRGSLAVMLDRVDEWVPDSFTGTEIGESLTIELVLIMAGIDSAVSNLRESSSHQVDRAMEEVKRILKDLEDDD